MINTYPHSSMQDMNLDWLLEVGKEAKKSSDEWNDIKGTAQSEIDKAIRESLDSGEIGKVVDKVTEKILNDEISPLKETVSDQGTEISNLKKRSGLFDLSGRTIIIGDSYTVGYTPDGNITPWTKQFLDFCSIDNAIIKANGGASFSTSDNSFLMLLNQIPADDSVKQILVVGGYNEFGSYSEIENAITAFDGAASVKFPNAKIFTAMVAWSVDSTIWNRLKIAKAVYSTQRAGWQYLTGSEYILHADGFMGSDGFHPNTTGQARLAMYLSNAVKTGSCSPSFYDVSSNFEAGDFSPALGSAWTLVSNYDYNKSNLIWGDYVCYPSSGTIVCDGTEYYVGRIYSTSFIGDGNGYTCYPTTVIVKSGALFYHIPAQINVRARQIYIAFYDVDDTKTNYRTLTNVTQVQIHRGSITL